MRPRASWRACARRAPGQYAKPAKFVPRLRGTTDFLDPLYAQPGTAYSGCATEMTDGYALGVTMLLTLTGTDVTALDARRQRPPRTPAQAPPTRAGAPAECLG